MRVDVVRMHVCEQVHAWLCRFEYTHMHMHTHLRVYKNVKRLASPPPAE